VGQHSWDRAPLTLGLNEVGGAESDDVRHPFLLDRRRAVWVGRGDADSRLMCSWPTLAKSPSLPMAGFPGGFRSRLFRCLGATVGNKLAV